MGDADGALGGVHVLPTRTLSSAEIKGRGEEEGREGGREGEWLKMTM